MNRRRGLSPRRAAFWLGSASVTAGVLLHLPMFLGSASDHYRLSGMPIDGWMVFGMALITVGLALVAYGLSPTTAERRARTPPSLRVSALDGTRLGVNHVLLLAALTVAIAVDTEKPFTFTFILPGVTSEYGLSAPGHRIAGALPVALLPLVAITGTVIGSLLWGQLADRFGRRPAILLAALAFVATSICGAMPGFLLNCTMCFFMGASAGGLLPVAYSLMTEIIPARRRGQVVVLVAGIGTGLGFLLTAATASWLMPTFGWRIMWFLGLPTGLLLILLNRFIPESPRLLLEQGRGLEAEATMRRFGAALVTASAEPAEARAPGLRRRRLIAISGALGLYGLGWGMVNFGFLTWLPSDAGQSVSHVSGILTNAAFFSMPGAVAVAWLYSRWSTRGTMVLVGGLTALTLAGFAALGRAVVSDTAVFTALLVCLLVSLWGAIAVLAPYSAEVYPTRLRARGSGLAAGASKLGGVLALALAVGGLAPPALGGSAVLLSAAMALGALAIGVAGVETRRRRLEEINGAEAPPQAVGQAVGTDTLAS